jgi:predicted small secreted protein
MKRMGFFVLVVLMASACNNSSGFGEKVDTLSKKIDSGAEAVWDSTKAGAKKLKDKIEDKLDRKDSTKKLN